MPKRWIEPTDDRTLSVETLLTRRGFTDPAQIEAFFDPGRYVPAPPFDLPDMGRAVERIERAISGGERILIWGDFDVDGQTATSLLVEALDLLGGQVSHYIPDRNKEGHGIHTRKLGELLDADNIRVVLTCDTGIAAHAAVDYANSRGVEVVITDHHQLADTLPDAYAAVNPQRLDEGHPLRTLPGVGVAYKLVEALYMRAGRSENDLTPLLDLVALGIVADVAVLVDDTRYLLQRGLDVLRNTTRPGLRAMMELAKITPAELTETDIGFGIGPRMNALGRLDDANKAVELLTTKNSERAQILANMLEGLNNNRKNMSNQVLEGAEAQLAADKKLIDNYHALVLSSEHWPGGIVGIVANRLAERYDRPVILLKEEDGIMRGSARSVDGVDITAAIATHADLLNGYGGHTMAAGLSLDAANLPEFRRRLSNTVRDMRAAAGNVESELTIDAFVPLGALSLELVDDLRRLAPFGPGNPAVVVATRKVTLKSQRQLGRDGRHQKLTVEDENGDLQDVLWWQANLDDLPKGRFDLAYTLGDNVWKDVRSLQLELVDLRPVDEEPLTFEARSTVDIIDHRGTDDPAMSLHGVLDAYPDALIWSEAVQPPHGKGRTRQQLENANTLVIWTAPPDPDTLRAALKATNPAQVVLFCINPGIDSLNGFLQRVAGLVNYALNNKGGAADLNRMAAAMAARPGAVRVALEWMAERGKIGIDRIEDEIAYIHTNGEASGKKKAESNAKLIGVLSETAAYRAHVFKADAESLLAMAQ